MFTGDAETDAVHSGKVRRVMPEVADDVIHALFRNFCRKDIDLVEVACLVSALCPCELGEIHVSVTPK